MNNKLSNTASKWSLLNLLESIPEALLIIQKSKTIVFANKSARKLFGYRMNELIGQRIDILVPDYLRTKFAKYIKHLTEIKGAQIVNLTSTRYGIKSDGSLFPAQIIVGPRSFSKSAVMIFLIHDITEQLKIKNNSQLFQVLLDQTTDAIEILDATTGKFLGGNVTAWKTLKYTQEEFLSLNIVDVDIDLDMPEFYKRINHLQKYEKLTVKSRHRRKDGSIFPVEVSIKFVRLEKNYLIAIARDITKLSKAEKIIQHQLTHDSVTNLPNMVMLKNIINQNITMATQNKYSFALLSLSINNYDELVNTIGYELVHELLKQFGPRIKNIPNSSAKIFCVGSHEFIMLFEFSRISETAKIVAIALRAFDLPFIIKGIPINLELSAGIATFPKDGKTYRTLTKRANIALNVSKRSSEPIFYEEKYNQYKSSLLELMGDLRNALAQGELELYYQPQVEVQSRAIIGVEALLRWHHPNRGILLPQQFIPLAEHTALIHLIGLWVINSAVQQSNLWYKQGIIIRISINLSVRNFLSPKIYEYLCKLVQKKLNKRTQLEIEITETAIMQNPEYTAKVIEKLKSNRIKMAIDDFGKGYSSLGYLKRFAVDTIKIDKYFIKNMRKNSKDYHIVKSIIDLAHHLKITALAEGVENKETLEILRLMGCDMVQGFYTGRPMNVKELTYLLMHHNGGS